MRLQLDDIDRRLLRILQVDGRKTVQELGNLVGLSPSGCHRRVKALEDRGLIEGYEARLDTKRLGYSLEFFIEVGLAGQSVSMLNAFEKAVRDIPEVLECHLMAGQSDYLLRVACLDTEDFERVHRRLTAHLPGVARLHSNMSIRVVKERSKLPF